MTKILKPYTIIPAQFYVEREADMQVKSIVEDMVRPGYVLVSRQMGKTNLLINAKRSIESNGEIFIYVDLSNTFQTARECFRNIIDAALDSHLDRFHEVRDTIITNRTQEGASSPYKEHLRELKELLGTIGNAKIIIMLDEIDALIKTAYSDQIFSQIRSNYFDSRVRSEDFYRLTYLLSGVLEPTEIIKDSKISPFNIGQKIYLNNFTESEFHQFISKSGLVFPKDVIDRIYYWTNGNPRMSWDLSSEVEDFLIAQGSITKGAVDQIVKKHYLTSFDKPPVDNIREIVRQDFEIRSVLKDLTNGKGIQVSDKLKKKLYLAGITDYIDDIVEIKNRIILESLNSTWLENVEEEIKSYDLEVDPDIPYFFVFGQSNSGKTAMVNGLIHYLKTMAQGQLEILNSSDKVYHKSGRDVLFEMSEDVEDSTFNQKGRAIYNEQNFSPNEINLLFTPDDIRIPIMPFCLLDMVDESMQEAMLTDGGIKGDRDGRVNAYLQHPDCSLVFVLVINIDFPDESEDLIVQFLDYAKSLGHTNNPVLFAVNKWDLEKEGYDSIIDYFQEKLPILEHLRKDPNRSTAIMDFSIGKLSESEGGVYRYDLKDSERLMKWMYQITTGYSYIEMGESYWERLIKSIKNTLKKI
ncbi:MAG: hypothetical protein GQ574_27445 [Crocinitomix sp.]|nr:hypothetical protein [Crocinitomix sp.]